MSALNSIQTLPKHLKAGQNYKTSKAPGSGDAYWLNELSKKVSKPIIVICANPIEAHRLNQEVKQFNSALKVHLFPDWETLPYDSFSPHQDLISERLSTLNALMHRQLDVLLIPVKTALYKLPPADFIAAYSFSFKKGETLKEQALKKQLVQANYEHVSQVTRAGEFSIRGSLIDLFPMGSSVPYRIDLFDDEIDSIRAFDVDTQRSLYTVNEINLLPGREFSLNKEAINHFRSRFRESFEGDPTKTIPYQDISNGIAFAGIEYYLPLFHDQMSTLFDYLDEDALLVINGNLEEPIQQFTHETKNRYLFLNTDTERPILNPTELFINQEEFFLTLKQFAKITWQNNDHEEILLVPDVSAQRRAEQPFNKLQKIIQSPDRRTILCVDSAGRRETLLSLFQENSIQVSSHLENLNNLSQVKEPFSIVIAPLFQGFYLKNQDLLILTENDIYPDTATSYRRNKKSTQRTEVDAMVRDLSELREGDPVVHVEYGIGRYLGLKNMTLGEEDVEVLQLQYANESLLYVPVSQLHVISRYGGADAETAPLHTLGSGQWDKARKKAAKQVRDTAAELLNLYAHRSLRHGHQFKIALNDYEQFASEFGFEETADQKAAIDDVIADMTSGRSMDRLVCGDVGFGKTEVALRAAFICVAEGKQVALLCPTTLLAEQHAQTFADRFADWPVKIAELSRFKTTKAVNQTLEELKKGSIDIVIGTHKILSKSTEFKDLGLVIIDEEHRFGVRQKEKLKALRAEVDVLTLTATPIPRTLGMSLDGVRDFSIIATAPEKRLAIKTFVRREDNSTIREAVLRELNRGGQIYFLHNEVNTIYNRLAQLQEVLPEARIAVAHGQMPERELEQVMKGFYQKRFNILLCTTIIETGIDVPSANTIIIHRADRLGLAQLHQLRGRVGRSHHQAYAYLLIPGEEAITKNAKKRLEAIQSMEDLGAGFYLAMHDLEIRGTGEILGDSQSGNIQEVGLSLYTEMLNEAIHALKRGEEPNYESPFESGCEIKLYVSALLPNDYCPDINSRLSFYKRLSHVKNLNQLTELKEELIDRFGLLPEAAKMLILTHKLRILAEPFGISKIDIGDDIAQIHFYKNTKVDPVSLIDLIQNNKDIQFNGPDKLKIKLNKKHELELRAQAISQIIQKLELEKQPETVS